MRATEFDGFSGKVIPGRWAMIADCSLQMAVVEVSLRWGWVLEKYQGKEIKARHYVSLGSAGMQACIYKGATRQRR